MSLFVPLYDQSKDEERGADESAGGETTHVVDTAGNTAQEGAVWEICFSDEDRRRPAKPMPKGLREKAERLKQARDELAASKPATPSSKSKAKKPSPASGSKSKPKVSPVACRSATATPTRSDTRVSGARLGVSSDRTKRSPVTEKEKKSPISRFSILSRKASKSQESTKPADSPASRGGATGTSPRTRPNSADNQPPSISPRVTASNRRPKSSPASSRHIQPPRPSSPKPRLRQRQLTSDRDEEREEEGTDSLDLLDHKASPSEPKVGRMTEEGEEQGEELTGVMEGSTRNSRTTWEITVPSSDGREGKPDRPSISAASYGPFRQLRRLPKVTVPARATRREEREAARPATTPQEMGQRKVLDLKRW